MASITASDQVDSSLPDFVGVKGSQQEAQPPLSDRFNLRDAKFGVGSVRGSQLEDPKGC